MRSNAAQDFKIDDADMGRLKSIERIKDYGESSAFPVFRGN